MAQTFAPSTGTPEVDGPDIHEALEYVRGLYGLDIKGFYLVELLSEYDHGEITTALTPVDFGIITLIAMKKRDKD